MTSLTILAVPLSAALASLAFAVTAGAQAAPQEPSPRTPRIVVTGTGKTKATPDVAYVALGVVTAGKRAQEASQANAAAADRIMAALKKQGIAERDIQTASYNVQPVYKNNDFSKGIDGYQVSNVVRATVRKLDTLGSIIDAGLDAGANNVQGVSFGLEKQEAADERALTSAVQEARRKAEIMARAAGVRITKVMEISTVYEGRPVPMQFGGDVGMLRAATATPVSPGELDVTANVTMVFAIDAPEGARDASGK